MCMPPISLDDVKLVNHEFLVNFGDISLWQTLLFSSRHHEGSQLLYLDFPSSYGSLLLNSLASYFKVLLNDIPLMWLHPSYLGNLYTITPHSLWSQDNLLLPNIMISVSHLIYPLFSSWSWYQFLLLNFWCLLKSLLFPLFSK